ncbi:aspartate aminotransferase family protein [Blattabacterium cuenoti]|uniref:aspartate aminotransferase family protein n=1 Tax=Blattabacterium cuenoti TaxID=1653831 RepID=UPI00163B7557|nr:aspartate aminotransferase family protein [Blattabacterium cuenoti]
MSIEKEFIKYQAQTSNFPIKIEINSGKGSYLYGKNGKKYLDFISGVSVNILGHRNKKINNSIKKQIEKSLHTMVYGEFINKNCVKLCKKISKCTPKNLTTTYLVNSGTEAVEGAIKLAKIYTNKKEIIACRNSYHGSTYGSLSLINNNKNKVFDPLNNIKFINFNDKNDIKTITNNTACVILETIQCSSGIILPDISFLKEIRNICNKKKVLMILDEVQTGFGRTGKLFAFEHYNVSPDILIIGKGMGGGMPISAFVSSNKIMRTFCDSSYFGHFTTFGGNPVSVSASLSTLDQIINSKIIEKLLYKEKLIRKYLVHPKIIKIHGIGLLLGIELSNKYFAEKLLIKCIKNGLILFRFLFCDYILRITPPLNIKNNEIKKGCLIIIKSLNQIK